MLIASFTPTSGSFYQKIQEVSSFDKKVNLCIENVDLYNSIQKKNRRSPHLLNKFFVGLCKKYPQGFESSFKIVKIISSIFVVTSSFQLFKLKLKKRKKKKKMETAVKIEKEIENLYSLQKFSNFLNIVNLCHVEKCEKNDCGTCYMQIYM